MVARLEEWEKKEATLASERAALVEELEEARERLQVFP